ncbi:membrane protein [Sediminicola sp. YIK13]|uniref:OmpA family protein n=1 Tax=Sediminicola sp. YIK13 TaxID=1453352 RepID=UPI0007208F5A|nr:OmpA family protein [Sediminicola sp. YIK13]ALM06773.1 membrane protein [Sediminicola sp. YIK13]
MKNFHFNLFVAFSLVVTLVSAQESMELTAKDSIVKSSWVVGLGINIVDDTSSPYGGNLLDIKDSWNTVPYPSSVSIARNFSNGLGLKAVGSYNKYKVGKLIDGAINMAERDYYAIDGMVSYDLNKLFGETGWFDPFLQAGAGYSSIGDIGRTTGNAGFGFNTWFSDTWGLNFNTMGKWGLEEGSTKQVQHSAGVVYRFGVEKALSKKGMEHLASIEAMKKEQQRVQDSTDAADRAKELAKRMAEEQEAARLAAAEKTRIEAENKRRAQIENDIKNLGKIYFAFNSSTLNTESKATLTQLATLMDATPSITLEVASYTDSRGPANYNLGLSERRVKSTIDYLLGQGLSSERLIPKAYGETNLVNECDDNTPCSAAKHRLNRRSEFLVIRF